MLDNSEYIYGVALGLTLANVVEDLHARGKCGNDLPHNLHLKYNDDVLDRSLPVSELFGLVVRPDAIVLEMTSFPTHLISLNLPFNKNSSTNVYTVHVHADLCIDELFDYMSTDVGLPEDPNKCCLVMHDQVYHGHIPIHQMLGAPDGIEKSIEVGLITTADGGDTLT